MPLSRFAKLGKRVAVAEMKSVIGGACINTGTIPSKTLREAVLYLSGWRQRGFYGRLQRLPVGKSFHSKDVRLAP
mgnify:FL=1